MRNSLLTSALALIPLLAPAALRAEDAALILGNERYEQLGRLPGAAAVVDEAQALAAFGFDVQAVPNARAGAIAQAMGAFAAAAPEADRLIVALAGRFATDGSNSWLILPEVLRPAYLRIGAQGVSVDALMTVLAQAPGQALLLIGHDPEQEREFDIWLREGLGDLEIPQGVTVVTGSPGAIARVIERTLTLPQADLIAELADNDDVVVRGYVPDRLVLMPALVPDTPRPPPDTNAQARAAEDALWQGAVALDTVDAYRNYLARYPLGVYAEQAELAIEAIVAEPNRDARLAEEALNLSRDQRRAVQENLVTLNFDPRGIDGIFGPGTRRAIANWQQVNGYPQTTYLTTEQINRIDAQAARRRAEIAAEAERQAAEAARIDRLYWEETGADGDEAGLRAYLSRYPEGEFAALARERLAEIEAEQLRAADDTAYQTARAADTVRAWNTYLTEFPEGRHTDEARARIAQLQADANQPDLSGPRAQEQALGLNALTSRMVESRLEQMGLNPGTVDGQFDRQTRRAIARYQDARDLPVTGFLNETTLVRLLADTLQQIE
jgi:peptidoglycan hydrolase-like protein with peptidoglycan-binding domain